MGKINAAWRVAMATMGQHFTKEEHASGWPQTLKYEQLAALQYPYSKGDTVNIRLARARASDILNACKSGELIHTANTVTVTPKPPPVQHRNKFVSEWPGEFERFKLTGVRTGRITSRPTPQPRDVTTYTVTAPAFAAWLAAQNEASSAHIAAWFKAAGVAGAALPVADTAPQDESLDDRNMRWLNHYETEERTQKRGAYIRTAAHFGAEASTLRKAVDKAREQRAMRARAGLKTVATRRKATPFSGLGTLVKDGRKTFKKQR